MGYLTVKQLSEKWGISERRIINLCREDRISGAIKNGMVWLIPEDTLKPADKRNNISQYINTQKRVIIININNEIGYNLIPLLEKQGYKVDGIYNHGTKINNEKLANIKVLETNYKEKSELEILLSKTEKYYDGLIFIDIEEKIENKEWLIKEFAKKMNCESSIVLVNNLKRQEEKLEIKLAKDLKENIGVRINTVSLDIAKSNNVIVNYNEIAEDIVELLTKFKNTTGMNITTNGGAIEFDATGKTEQLSTGEFYKAINHYFKDLNKESYLWCASTMMEDEWTEEPLEMQFRVTNLEAANRGVKIDRIFIFSKSKIKEFKDNKTLKIYMQSNINTMFVDYDEILEKEPELLKIVGDGWDGIDEDTLIVDMPAGEKERGYISINKNEVQKSYKCFQELKKYAKDLKEILK